MRYLILFTLVFLASCGDSTKVEELEEKIEELENNLDQVNESPDTKEEAVCNALNDFIPEGWKILKKVNGDLNKDGLDDYAIVLQGTDKSNMQSDEYMEIDSNPRELVILFGKEKANCYDLAVRSSTFIPAHEEMHMDDPFEEMAITNGTLHLDYRIWYSMGSWYTSTYTYIWRFQDDDFKLIGANSSEFHRASGEATDVSINFSTNKCSITKYNMFESDEEVEYETSEEWKDLNLKELKTFKTFQKPWSWEVIEGVYI